MKETKSSTKEKKGKSAKRTNSDLLHKKNVYKKRNDTIESNKNNEKESKKSSEIETKKKNDLEKKRKNEIKNEEKSKSDTNAVVKNDLEIKKKKDSKNNITLNQLHQLSNKITFVDDSNMSKSFSFSIRTVDIEFEKETKNFIEINLSEALKNKLFINSHSIVVNKNYLYSLLQKNTNDNTLHLLKTSLTAYEHEDILIFQSIENANKFMVVTNIDTYEYFIKKNRNLINKEEKQEKLEETEKQMKKEKAEGVNNRCGNDDVEEIEKNNYIFIQPKTYFSANEEEIKKEIISTNITQNRKSFKNYIYVNKYEINNDNLELLDQENFVSFKNEMPKETRKDQTLDFFSTNSVNLQNSNTQTHRPIYKSIGTQYNIDFLRKKKEEIMKSTKIQKFLSNILPKIEKSIIENLIISQKEEQKQEHFDAFTSKNKNNLKKLFIYADVKYTTDKIILFTLQISNINHLIFIVYINNNKNDNYIEGVNADSYILIWHFHNYINPIYAFISPYQITSAVIKEAEDNLIIAGCNNGMLVIWKLPPQVYEKADADSKINEKTIDVEPFIFSNIEQTHKREVTSLVLLKDKILFLCEKKYAITQQHNSYLLISVSVDGTILIWDVTNIEILKREVKKKKKKKKEPNDELYNFKPLLKISITKPNTECNVGFTYFHFLEVTHNIASFFAFSEEGEYVLGDLYGLMHKNQHYSVINKINDEYKNFKTLLCVKRNRILKFILLSLTDTNFYLWKEDEVHPLYISPMSSEIYSCCEFSSTKIGVVFIGKINGQIEIWDLIEQKNHYVCSLTISSYSLTCINMFQNFIDKSSGPLDHKREYVNKNFEVSSEFNDTNEHLTSKGEDDVYGYSYNKIIIGDSSGCVFVYELNRNLLNSSKEEKEEYLRWVENRVLINRQKVKRQEELNFEKDKGLNDEEKRVKERKENLRIKLDEDYKNILEKYKNCLVGDTK